MTESKNTPLPENHPDYEKQFLDAGFYDRSNMESVDVPRPGCEGSQHSTDLVPADAIGPYVARRCEALLERDMSASSDFGHYVGWMQGMELLDTKTSRQLDGFVRALDTAPDQKKLFNSEIKPFLYSLRGSKRPAAKGGR